MTFVVDRSERGKLALTGAEAKDFLQGQVTNDVLGLTPGQGCYAAFLTHKGKMLGDMRVFDLGDELLLDCERVVLQELFNMIRRFKLGREVELHKRTLEMALLSVIGPEAPRLAGDAEHSCARVAVGGVAAIAVTTDVGTDLFCAADDREALRDALDFPDGDEATAEIVRVERGRPRYGVDLDDSGAGRDRFVRNVLIAIGNSGDASLAAEAERRLADPSPLVRGAAVWALGRLDRGAARRAGAAARQRKRPVGAGRMDGRPGLT